MFPATFTFYKGLNTAVATNFVLLLLLLLLLLILRQHVSTIVGRLKAIDHKRQTYSTQLHN